MFCAFSVTISNRLKAFPSGPIIRIQATTINTGRAIQTERPFIKEDLSFFLIKANTMIKKKKNGKMIMPSILRRKETQANKEVIRKKSGFIVMMALQAK